MSNQDELPLRRQFSLRWLLALTILAGLNFGLLAKAREHSRIIGSVLSLQFVLLLCGWFYYWQFPKIAPQFLPDRARRPLLGLGIATFTYAGILGSIAQVERAFKPPPDPRYVLHLPFYLSLLLWLFMCLFAVAFALTVGSLVYRVCRSVVRNQLDRVPARQEAAIIGAITGLALSMCLMFAISGGGALSPTWVFLVILLPSLLAATLCYLFSNGEAETSRRI